MARFILRRLSYNVLVLIGVLFFVHGLLLATGDPAASLLPIDAGAEALETVREKHGLNDPVPFSSSSSSGGSPRATSATPGSTRDPPWTSSWSGRRQA